MEPHSRPCSSQNGTLRLPQALLLLLNTVLAAPTSDRVTQTDVGLARWQNIKNTAHRLLHLINPFVVHSNLTKSLAVGMVKLTALCGIGSALWLWSNQKSKRKAVAPQHPSDPAVGKIYPNDRRFTFIHCRAPPGLLNLNSRLILSR